MGALAEAVATESDALITRDPREPKVRHATGLGNAVWVWLPAAQVYRWIVVAVPGQLCFSLLT